MTASSLSWTLDQAVARVGGRLLGADGGFRGVGIDSRQDLSGRLFVALPGERHDGHDFAASARDQDLRGSVDRGIHGPKTKRASRKMPVFARRVATL